MLYLLTICPFGQEHKQARATFDQGQKQVVYAMQRSLIIRGYCANVSQVTEPPIRSKVEISLAKKYLTVAIQPVTIEEWKPS